MDPTLEQMYLANNDYAELRKFITNKDYIKFLSDRTAYLSNASVKQRLFHYLNHIKNIQICDCGVPVKWNTKNNTYRTFCSSKCAHTSDLVKTKTRETCMSKFGTTTNLTSPLAKELYTDKMMQKYGTDNPFKSKHVQQSIKETIFKKYGVHNICELDDIKEKINNTHLNRYGRLRQSQSHFSDESYSAKHDKQLLSELYNKGSSIKDIAAELDVGHSQLCIKFKELGIEVRQGIGQQQLYDYIKSIYVGDVIFNDRASLGGKEIDIFIPALRIGFEYDGIFWHSQCSSGKTSYHADKDRIARSAGIKLYHIIDIEWNNKRDLIKSRISAILGSNTIIYGRKTTLTILSSPVANAFFNDNHLCGYAPLPVLNIGLEFDGKLVAAMSFSQTCNKPNVYDLTRFCSLQGVTIIGGISKLFSYAVTYLAAEEIFSRCNIRLGSASSYNILGFTHIRTVNSYFYTNQYRTIEYKPNHMQAAYIKNSLNWAVMKDNKYDRYWESGIDIYKWAKLS